MISKLIKEIEYVAKTIVEVYRERACFIYFFSPGNRIQALRQMR